MTLVADRGGEILRRLPPGPIQGAEVGVYDGRLSAWLLRESPQLTLIMVDRWRAVTVDHPYRRSESEMAKLAPHEWNVVMGQARHAVTVCDRRAVLLRGESVEVASLFQREVLDFVFLDADHRREAVEADIVAWLPAIRHGGWICGHDWDHPETHTAPGERRWGVKEAVLMHFDAERIELGANRTWFVRVSKS